MKKVNQVRAVLKANRTHSAVVPPLDSIPDRRPFEVFVDYEYFTNVDVDFERKWLTMEGSEMIFMISGRKVSMKASRLH